MRQRSLVLLLFLVAAPQIAYTDQEQDLVGVYACEGVNARGQSYRGIVEIILTGQVLQLRWTLDSGDVAYGLGLRDGKRLSVSYAADGTIGLVVYKIKGHRLTGRWTGPGATGTFAETLTRQKPGAAAPVVPSPSPHQQPPHRGRSREANG